MLKAYLDPTVLSVGLSLLRSIPLKKPIAFSLRFVYRVAAKKHRHSDASFLYNNFLSALVKSQLYDKIKIMKIGLLKQNGVHLQDHEYATVKLLLEKGYDIELIPPSQIKNLRMPDIMMCELPWEMKAPEGKSKYTAQNIIQDAAKQAQNVIIDLRRCKLPEEKAISDFDREFNKSKHIKRMKIIRKNLEILDFSK